MSRRILFALLFVVTVTAGIAYLMSAADRAQTDRRRPVAGGTASVAALQRYFSGPHIAFRSNSDDMSYGRIAVAPLARPEEKFVGEHACARLDLVPGGGALCLLEDFGLLAPYQAVLLDRQLREVWRTGLQGIPSRVRVSPDGRLAAITVFVAGHSYAEAGFSTLTTIVDVTTGKVLTDLEQFAVTREGRPFDVVDFNFWGVTFMDDGRTFFATLSTGGKILLVRGDVRSRTAEVVADDVECPSLSPDGTRLAFKRRRGGTGLVEWRLHVLDLRTFDAVPLAETRNVDDQVEWLDDDRIIYAVSNPDRPSARDTWVVPADGSGTPEPFRRLAESVVVGSRGRTEDVGSREGAQRRAE